ncbi:cytochrome c oxidase subunit 7C, mitochondrial [Podarcis lilfordi]|uniref:Cytochrome c oxidase subunit 7C, mitochondrial n=1 Tax=Podarcis lilfordi TaxID=74358 RepID=A0AA35L1B0_9SAUR|nr:cytochrome c oxidase subunit 7C, mitochondrial [Podarcis lilfordi]
MLGVSVRRFATSAIRRSHYEEGPGKNLPFSVENKWRLLAPAAQEVNIQYWNEDGSLSRVQLSFLKESIQLRLITLDVFVNKN